MYLSKSHFFAENLYDNDVIIFQVFIPPGLRGLCTEYLGRNSKQEVVALTNSVHFSVPQDECENTHSNRELLLFSLQVSPQLKMCCLPLMQLEADKMSRNIFCSLRDTNVLSLNVSCQLSFIKWNIN